MKRSSKIILSALGAAALAGAAAVSFVFGKRKGREEALMGAVAMRADGTLDTVLDILEFCSTDESDDEVDIDYGITDVVNEDDEGNETYLGSIAAPEGVVVTEEFIRNTFGFDDAEDEDYD